MRNSKSEATTTTSGEMMLKAAITTIICAIILATLMTVRSSLGEQPPRHLEVTARRFEFNPSEITLKKGEPVVLVLKSMDVPHGVRFRELGIEAKASKGQSVDLAFTPDKVGDFVGHCAVFCGAGHGEMILKLHIIE